MKSIGVSIVATAMLFAGCSTMSSAPASAQRAKEEARLALYQAAAGAPVSSINNVGIGMQNWDTIDGSHIVYMLSPNRQYLMTLGGTCMDWASGPVVGITSDMGRISVNFDSVRVSGGLSCSIQQIQPLDMEKLKEGSQPEMRSS